MKKINVLLLILSFTAGITAQEPKTMYVMKDGEPTHEIAVSEIDSVIFYKPSIPDRVVINGVTWATRNVDKPGEFAAKSKDYGMFYQGNRRVGWSVTDPLKNSNNDGTAWNPNPDTGTAWVKSNDPCPPGWRVPTSAQIDKLLDATKVEFKWENGCGTFTDMATGTSIFFPAAGYRFYYNGTLGSAGSDGYYWSSSQDDEYNSACFLYFYSGRAYRYGNLCSHGFSVRCVEE